MQQQTPQPQRAATRHAATCHAATQIADHASWRTSPAMDTVDARATDVDDMTVMAISGDRYRVRVHERAHPRAFDVVDVHQANAVVATYPTLKQAAVESAFLSLLHLRNQRACAPAAHDRTDAASLTESAAHDPTDAQSLTESVALDPTGASPPTAPAAALPAPAAFAIAPPTLSPPAPAATACAVLPIDSPQAYRRLPPLGDRE